MCVCVCVCFDQNIPVFFFMPLSRGEKAQIFISSRLDTPLAIPLTKKSHSQNKKTLFLFKIHRFARHSADIPFFPSFFSFLCHIKSPKSKRTQNSRNLRCSSRIYTRRKINWWLRRKIEYLIGDLVFYKYNCPQITHKQQFIFNCKFIPLKIFTFNYRDVFKNCSKY